MADDENRWMGTSEAAAYLGVTPRTLYRFLDSGEIPAYKLGRVLRVRRKDLDAFLQTVRLQPGELRHLLPPRKGDAPATVTGAGPDPTGPPFGDLVSDAPGWILLAEATNLTVEELHARFPRLSERARVTIGLRYGLDGRDPERLEEVAAHLSVTRSRVVTIEAKGVDDLREPPSPGQRTGVRAR